MSNNFRELEEEWIAHYGSPPNQVREEIQSSRGMFRFLGDITEMLIPKLFGLLIDLFSPDRFERPDRPYNEYPNLDK